MISVNHTREGVNPEDSEPSFRPGQLVRHRRYGYRGVIVDVDGHCKADPVWYMSNKTQPDRDQPWYHVLVHDSVSVTYAAESSLKADDSEEPVNHALVEHFFSSFNGRQYIRNDEPLPDQ